MLHALMALLVVTPAAGQDTLTTNTFIQLDDLSAFRNPTPNWKTAGSVNADRQVELDFSAQPGTGVIVNVPSEGAEGHLTTELEHGDIVLELQYLMPKGSNSGIYLQGRYEIQLFDSWGVRNPTYAAAAGIYQRWDESRPEGERGYEGHPPRINASRAPGLWQHLRIEFLAPEFDSTGRKAKNAVVRRVIHNGAIVHENVALSGPTRSSAYQDEAARGPIVIQGDHGPVALKNIRYSLDVPPDTGRSVPDVQPVLVDVGRDPVFVRSMAEHGDRKITHALNVGFPQGMHYSVDLSNGAVFRIWRGPFADATPMWYSRGIDQTLTPRGAALELSDASSIGAVAPDGKLRSDSTAYRFHGYHLREDGVPVLMYSVGDVRVDDVTAPTSDGLSLVREMTFRSEYDASDVWVRIAEGDAVERVGDRTFAVDGRAYYVELDDSLLDEAYVHHGADGAALVVPVGESGYVRYTWVW